MVRRALLACLGAGALRLGAAPADPLRQSLDAAARGLGGGGFAVAEVRGGQFSYFAAGDPAPRPGIPPQRVIFEIGSITKVFTGLLLAQAVVEGRAGLDDPIGPRLPPELGLAPATAGITLEELATHTSGLPRIPDNFQSAPGARGYADYTVQDLYAFLRAYRPPTPPPCAPDYSNLGIGLLGHVLERIYGEPYGRLVEEKIARPLGLGDTVAELSSEQRGRLAPPHAGAALRPAPLLPGAGSLHSTAADLARFAWILASGGGALRPAWELARRPRHDAPLLGGRVGLGVLIKERDGRTLYWHDGSVWGYRSYLEWDARKGDATAILLDADAADPGRIVDALAAPRPAAEGSDRPEVPLPAERAAGYLGVYAVNASARVTVLPGPDGRLWMRPPGQPFFPLRFEGGDRFFLGERPVEIEFTRGADGRVAGLTVAGERDALPAWRSALPPPKVLFLSDAKLAEYAGRYDAGSAIVFTLQVRAGALYAQFAGQPALPVFADRPDHFVYDSLPAALRFVRAPDGSLTGFIFEQKGRPLFVRRAGP